MGKEGQATTRKERQNNAVRTRSLRKEKASKLLSRRTRGLLETALSSRQVSEEEKQRAQSVSQELGFRGNEGEKGGGRRLIHRTKEKKREKW